jgi:two-component system cell cycle sensor histidine kinase/response regulator CckA
MQSWVFIQASVNPAEKQLAYIVDDEPMLLDLNEAMLRSMGFEVRRFRSAEQAFETYRSEVLPPAIIVTDFSMQQMTGLDLIEACRAIHTEQKFLLLSGTVDASAFRETPAKPNHFMAKPYATDEFAGAVWRVLNR